MTARSFSQQRLSVNHKGIMGFPPPDYIRVPAAGVNLSDHGIKMIAFKEHSSGMIIEKYADLPLPSGAVVQGDIKKSDEVAAGLSQLCREHDVRFVRASVPEEKVYIFRLRLPAMGPKELRSAIEFQLAEHIPLSASETAFDYDVVVHNEKKNMLSLAVSALPRSVVESYMQLFAKAGLSLLSLQTESQAIAQAVLPHPDTDLTVLVDIGRTRTGISIADRGIVRYTSTIDLGGDALTESIRRHMQISQEEADRLKQEKGFTKNSKDSSLYTSLINTVSALTDEVRRRIDYWHTHVHSKSGRVVSSAILCGGNATVPGLREYLEMNLGIPVSVANVWRNVFSTDEYIPPIDFRHSVQYAAAVGLALSQE